MYSRSAKVGEKGEPNRNPWLAKMGVNVHETKSQLIHGKQSKMKNNNKSVALHLEVTMMPSTMKYFSYLIVHSRRPQ
jgi:hypothetical protein